MSPDSTLSAASSLLVLGMIKGRPEVNVFHLRNLVTWSSPVDGDSRPMGLLSPSQDKNYDFSAPEMEDVDFPRGGPGHHQGRLRTAPFAPCSVHRGPLHRVHLRLARVSFRAISPSLHLVSKVSEFNMALPLLKQRVKAITTPGDRYLPERAKQVGTTSGEVQPFNNTLPHNRKKKERRAGEGEERTHRIGGGEV
ncbi:hypothetical protein NL676_020272 [Syzygium grande]|nr:hypothetical protein NL676_020272 [Syzygium grande]